MLNGLPYSAPIFTNLQTSTRSSHNARPSPSYEKVTRKYGAGVSRNKGDNDSVEQFTKNTTTAQRDADIQTTEQASEEEGGAANPEYLF